MVLYFIISALLATVIVLTAFGILTPKTVKLENKQFYQNTLIILASALCLTFVIFGVAEIFFDNQLLCVILNVSGLVIAVVGIILYFFRKKEYNKISNDEVETNE